MNWWEQEEAEQKEAEQKAYEAQMQAMYDEQQREQQLSEQVTWLQEEVERLKSENEVLRGERAAVVAWLREDAEILLQRYDRTCAHVEDLAAQIERGDHRREEKTP